MCYIVLTAMNAAPRWLLFVHQLPASPSKIRVKTWRRLQQIGAVPMKNSIYVLPNTAQTIEDFEWLRTEVVSLGGAASVFEAATISGVDETEIVGAFQAARARDFVALSKELRTFRATYRGRPDPAHRKALLALQERLDTLKRIDFFPSAASSRAEATMSKLRPEGSARRGPARARSSEIDKREYRHRLWVTRPRPGVDRFSSAWLIRRFIDDDARFVFAASPDRFPDAVAFDMYQNTGFKHEGELCTFEVLVSRFDVVDSAVARIAEIVHDLDLKDMRYKSPHAPTIGLLVDGLRASVSQDDDLLKQGIALFEALYQSFQADAPKRNRSKIC